LGCPTADGRDVQQPAVMAEDLPEIGTFFTIAKEKGLSISA
jgi:hypothetical protein